MEKIHGTSAHVSWKHDPEQATEETRYFSGGAKHDEFLKLFDNEDLVAKFRAFGKDDVSFYGEAYGGKLQGMKATYGNQLKFIVFDVRLGEHCWLSVPDAEKVANLFGFEFVSYKRISTEVLSDKGPVWLDAERDAPSEQAFRNGCADRDKPETWKKREGIVLRPPFEVRENNGARVCAKHKTAEFCERRTPQSIDAAQQAVLTEAEAIANEWVTEMRLTHVLDKLGNPTEMSDIPRVVEAMVEDVTREASGEILDSKAARRAISTLAVKLYKARVSKIGASDVHTN